MAVKYLLPCECGQVTTIEAGQAGQRVTCACGKSLAIPTMRGLSALEKVVQPEAKPVKERKWSRGQGILFSGGVVIALLSLLAAGYFGVVYSEAESNKSHMREHFELMADDDRLDILSGAELLEEWKNFQAAGLEEVDSAQWQQLSQLARHMTTAMAIALGIAAAGIITAASALFMRPKAT